MYQANGTSINPNGVIENDHVKLLWDYNIQTSTYIQARRPDVVVVDREKKTCNIIELYEHEAQKGPNRNSNLNSNPAKAMAESYFPHSIP